RRAPPADHRYWEPRAGTGPTAFRRVTAKPREGPPCPYPKCGFSYFGPQDAIAIDSAGKLYLAWQTGKVQTQRQSPPVINLSSCSSNCLSASSWSLAGRVDDKTATNCPNSACFALFPNIVAPAPR